MALADERTMRQDVFTEIKLTDGYFDQRSQFGRVDSSCRLFRQQIAWYTTRDMAFSDPQLDLYLVLQFTMFSKTAKQVTSVGQVLPLCRRAQVLSKLKRLVWENARRLVGLPPSSGERNKFPQRIDLTSQDRLLGV